MTGDILSLSSAFEEVDEATWLAAVSKALKGGSIERLTRQTFDGITIKPLYREADWPAATDPLGAPGTAPFLRGSDAARDAHLPWDIRQTFAHPDPHVTNAEILRDLAHGVSSIEIAIDPAGTHGCAITNADDLDILLQGVRGDLACIALAPCGTGAGYGLEAAALLSAWAGEQDDPAAQKLAFNLDPLGALARHGGIGESLESAFVRTAALAGSLGEQFPLAMSLRSDIRPVHEAGGSEAQELGALIAHGVDTLRRLDKAGMPPSEAASKLLFTLSIDANYGVGIAKLRSARRLWARCLEALNLDPIPMQIQAVTSARMLTRRDPWVNMLRGTAACFAASVGGADSITVRPFTDALGVAEELGRRTARNTQIIAMEESNLGKVADMAGGAWFTETLADDLAKTAWEEFQRIETEGGYGASLMAGAFQSRVAEARAALRKDVARRKITITGVSEFALLDEIDAPVADVSGWSGGSDHISGTALLTGLPSASGECSTSPLAPIRLAEPYERLRDQADTQATRPSIFLAALGPLAEHTARAAFARRLFAAGGIESKTHEVGDDIAPVFKTSGARLAVICGSDTRYTEEAEVIAKALKSAGVQRLYLAGKPGEHEDAWRAVGIDSFIHIGVDVIATLELAQAELGIV